jgi:hypothetical protein
VTEQPDDPIVAIQARMILDQEAIIHALEQQMLVLEESIASLKAIIESHERLRAVRATKTIQSISRNLRELAAGGSRELK